MPTYLLDRAMAITENTTLIKALIYKILIYKYIVLLQFPQRIPINTWPTVLLSSSIGILPTTSPTNISNHSHLIGLFTWWPSHRILRCWLSMILKTAGMSSSIKWSRTVNSTSPIIPIFPIPLVFVRATGTMTTIIVHWTQLMQIRVPPLVVLFPLRQS